MKKPHRKLVLTACAITALLCALFIIRYTIDKVPVNIGYIGSMTSKYAALGVTGRDGAVMAVEDLNNKEGIRGRPVVLTVMDDKGSPAVALEDAKKLAKSSVSAVIGPFITASATKVVPFLSSLPILTIGPTIAGSNLEKIDDYFIKLHPSTYEMGRHLGRLMFGTCGFKNIAIIADNTNKPYGDTLLSGVRTYVKVSGRHIATIVPKKGIEVEHLSEYAVEALISKPDAVLLICSPLDTAILAQHLKKLSPTIKLFSSSWGISDELLMNGGRAIENMEFFLTADHQNVTTTYRRFTERYRHRFGSDPSFASVCNYDAVMLLANAMEHTDMSDPKALKRYIVNDSSWRGVLGNYKLDRYGDSHRRFYRYTILRGHFMRVD